MSMGSLTPALVPRVGLVGDSGSGILRINRRPTVTSTCAGYENDGPKISTASAKRPKRTRQYRQYRPYISLIPESEKQGDGSLCGGGGSVEFGRRAILTSQYASCGCLEANTSNSSDDDTKDTCTGNKSKSDPDAGNKKKKKTGAKLNLCQHCREAESWCMRFLSRKLMKVTRIPLAVHKNPIMDCTDCSSDYTYRVQIRGENTLQFVSIDGSECTVITNNSNGDDSMHETDGEWKTVGTGSSQEQVVTLGSIISFRYPGENSAASGGGERSSKSLHFQLCLVSVSEMESASGVEVVVQRSSQAQTQVQAHDMEADGSDDAENESKPLTQRSDISTPRIGQNGSCSESQHCVPAAAVVGENLGVSIPVAVDVNAGGIGGGESQISALDNPPATHAAIGNEKSGSAVAMTAVAAPAACLSPTGSAPNASSSSSEEVPSSMPQNHQEATCMSPALLPRRSPRRSPSSHANLLQATPASGRSEFTVEVPSSSPPPRQLSTKDHQDPTPADTTVRESTSPNLETGASHQRAAVPSDGSQGPALGLAPTSQQPHALHDDTNTPRAATQRSIVDLMTPESSGGAGAGSNATARLRKGDGDQESSQRSADVAMEATPTDAAAAPRWTAGGKAHPSPIDLTTSPALKSPTSCALPGHSVVFFLKLGRGMAQSRIQLLSKTLEKKKADVRIVESFASSSALTHVVMDPSVEAANVASSLGFDSPEKMASHFSAKKIHAVTPHWVLTCENLQDDPGIDCLWAGFRRYQSAVAIKTKITKSKKRQISSKNGWMKSRNVDEFAPVNTIKASTIRDDDTSIGRVIRRKHGLDEEFITSSSVETVSHSVISAMRGDAPKRKNGALSAMFDELADLQKQSPLEKLDEWRAYTYTLVAGRLRHLDFEVTPNADTLGSIRGIRGFGSGVMEKIKQFFATGTCEKLKELKSDPARIAVRELTNIWGVGPKTASNLVNRGYRCIADVRRGLASGDIDISDNARVGVDCYEDFLEKMERSEVKLIGEIVAAAVYQIFPEAEVSTMGSYRRGKLQSGDADILILHPGFVSSTPKNSLARILKLLERDGRITNHLTTVKGASDGILSNDSQLSSYQDSQGDQEKLSVDDEYRAATTSRSLNTGDDHPESVSWMGVFRSPVHEGKRRRVDIKFYPYREKAFCKLYFTGSGIFNRSMRLWATKSCKMTLNDHGLFRLNVSSHHQYYKMKRDVKRQSRGERIDCKTERDIFEALMLEYRAPSERIDFDSVVEKGGAKPISLDDISEKDFAEESRQRWVQ